MSVDVQTGLEILVSTSPRLQLCLSKLIQAKRFVSGMVAFFLLWGSILPKLYLPSKYWDMDSLFQLSIEVYHNEAVLKYWAVRILF